MTDHELNAVREALGEGVHDIPAARYHADPCPAPSLSSSIAKILIDQSPLHAWFAHPRLNPAFEPEDESKFDFGSAMHAALLGGANVAVIDAPDYRTNRAKELRDAAIERGAIPILLHQWERVRAACDSVHRELGHHEAADALSSGSPEVTLIWREGPSWCRARLDWLPDRGTVYYDLKTTTDANPEAWKRRLFDLGADVQAAFYRRGIRAVLKIEQPTFRFVVVEAKEPFAVSVVQLSPSALDLAERKVADAIRIWQACEAAGKWPGYPPLVHHVDAPTWIEQRQMDKETRRQTMAELQVEYPFL